MKGAIVAAIVLAIFIALVEWRRHYAARAIPKRFDTKVAQAASRRTSRSERSGSGLGALVTRRTEDEKPEPPAGTQTEPDAGAAPPLDAEEAAKHRKKAEAVMDAIRRLLADERRDDAWADDIEAWIAAKSRTLAGTHLERVECRATLCLVAAVHDGEAPYASWISHFPAAEKNLRMITLPAALASGKTRTESFLMQEGRSLPANSR